MGILKKKLEAVKGFWADKLQEVPQSYQTTAQNSTGATPFSLTFGARVVIPIEQTVNTLDEDQNNSLLHLELDLLDEKKDKALLRSAE